MIEIKNITKNFGTANAIEDISLKLELESGILGICGAKASGKTALLDIIANVYPASSGEILINGKNIHLQSKEAKRTIGYMSECAPLFDEMTPFEFLVFIGEAKKISDEKLYRQIDEVLELTGIEDLKDKPISFLSRGKRKILSLAQTLLGNPSLIVLDEPFAGMTSSEASEAKSIIKMLGGIKTVIIATRTPSSIEDICSKIAIIESGRLVSFDTPEALKENAPAGSLDELCTIQDDEADEAEEAEEAESAEETEEKEEN